MDTDQIGNGTPNVAAHVGTCRAQRLELVGWPLFGGIGLLLGDVV